MAGLAGDTLDVSYTLVQMNCLDAGESERNRGSDRYSYVQRSTIQLAII
jgi:hypothetical protein